jgi:predicted adenine nucleotide alpha hydrolase (AANH) superfamily ATPase
MTAASYKKFSLGKSYDNRKEKSRNNPHSFTNRERSTARKKKSEVTAGSPAKSILFTEESPRKNSRIILLKKESFMKNMHQNIQYIRMQFKKSGGSLTPEKLIFVSQIEKVSSILMRFCDEG